MPIYRHGAKLVFFVHIPKTGGSSVELALRQSGCCEALRFSTKTNSKINYGKTTPQHIHASVYNACFPRDFFDFCFTIVRNPFARLASEYKMKRMEKSENAVADQWINDAFSRFKKYKYTRDNHIRPQNKYVSDHVKVFRFEEGLLAPINHALTVLECRRAETIPHLRIGANEKIVITKETLHRIQKFYAADFDVFKYDKEAFEHAFVIS
jgi:hypothetical protein